MQATPKEFIIALDEGTTNAKAVVLDSRGQVVVKFSQPLAIQTPREGWVEQSGEVLVEASLDVIAQAVEHVGAENIAALAISNQRETAIGWYRQSGKPINAAITWQCTRSAAFCDELRRDGTEQQIKAATGLPIAPLFSASKMRWLLESIPEGRMLAERGEICLGTIDSWLLWNLSEERTAVTTPTNATSAGAYILGEHRYFTDWVEAQDFPLELLPELKQDADDFGFTRQDILGIRVPIKASCGDQLGGLVGLGCHDAGQAMCVHGTGSFVDLVIGKQTPKNPGLYEATFTMTAWRSENLSHFAVETYAATTGSALNWLCNEMRWFENAREISELAATVPSSNGLFFMPTLTGLRQPNIVPDGRASLTGLSMAHSRAHLAHAILEGIAHSVVSCAEASSEVAGVPVREVVAGGGLSSSDTLLQLQADLSGVPVRRMADQDRASLRGTAFLAGSDGLLWSDLAEARATLPEGNLFIPKTSKAERQDRRARWHSLTDEEVARVQSGHYH